MRQDGSLQSNEESLPNPTTTRRDFLKVAGLTLASACCARTDSVLASPTRKPNIVFILADDLGYGDLGCYGQQRVQTPRLDRMAAEGMKFSQFYAGATVCAPSRSVLMTGLHTGHTIVRGNANPARQSLRSEDITVAEKLKEAGYTTALVGKWGLGDAVEEAIQGHPLNQGFDYFFGYLNQGHAHNYYPTYLYRGFDRVPLRNEVNHSNPEKDTGTATKRVDYSHDLFAEDALRWIRDNKDDPFFLYLSLTIPHANNEARRMVGDGAEVPDYGIYADKDWSKQNKGHAAMITRMDRDVGRLLDLLVELDIAEDTLVVFTSDNGHHNESGHDPEFFDDNGPLRGMKRHLYEGGIRVPTIAWWPGQIQPGTETHHIGYFGDFMATACELANQSPPTPNDSISFLPLLMGKQDRQEQHDYLYWEFYERQGARAIRQGNWKAVRPKWNAPVELYDLSSDLGEANDLAEQYPDRVERMAQLMEEAHIPSDRWKPPVEKEEGAAKG